MAASIGSAVLWKAASKDVPEAREADAEKASRLTSVSAASDRLGRPGLPSLSAVATVVVVAGAVAGAGASDGGYFPSSWGWAALFFSWSAVVALLVKSRVGIGRAEGVYLTAFTAVLGWTALSLFWTPTTTQTMYEVERTLSYVTFAVALALIARRRDVQVVLVSVLVAVTGLAAYGLLSRILPGRLTTFDAIAGYRLATPLGYWNAVAAICAFGTILAVGFAARSKTPVGRALAATTLVILVPTLYFTFGRGGWLALFVGLAAVVVLDPSRLQFATSLLVVAPWPVLALWRAYESKGLTTDFSPFATAASDGKAYAWTLLGLGIGAFAATLVYALLAERVSVPPMLRQMWAWALVLAVVVVVLGAVAAYGGPSRVVHRALDSIRQSSPNVNGDLTKRLFSLSSNGRLDLWSSAVDDADAHLLAGSGAGSFEGWWLQHRTVAMKVRDAHSLFAEQLAELGIVGLGLLVLTFATGFVAAWRNRRHPFVPIAFGALVAFLVHASVDWDWEMPAVTLCGLAFAGSLFLPGKQESYGTSTRAPLRLAGVAVLVAASAFAFVAMNGNRVLGQARNAADRGDPAAAARHARTAARWAPWSSEPISIQADAALEQGTLAKARMLYRQAIRKDSRDWELWFGLALASDGKAQDKALARAERLDPLAPEIQQLKASGV
jgi:hypothetical protein